MTAKAFHADVERKLNELEQYSCREKIVISGLSANISAVAMAANVNDPMAESATSVVDNAVSLCNHVLKVSVKAKDISVAHLVKLKVPRMNNATITFVRFLNRSVKERFYQARGCFREINKGRLADQQLKIDEDLTNTNRKIFEACQCKLKEKLVESTWTANGRVFIKLHDSTRHVVTSLRDLNHLSRTQ